MGDEKPQEEGAEELAAPGPADQASPEPPELAGPPPVGATEPLPEAEQTAEDETEYFPAADHTTVMPPSAWSGRAEVPPGGLRGPAPYPPAGYATGQPPPRPRTWWTPLLLGLLALGLVAIVVLAAWLISRDSTPVVPQPTATGQIVPTTTPAAPPTSAPVPSPTPSEAPELIEVPVLVGDLQDDAIAKLDAVGLSYRLEFRTSSRRVDTVIATDPTAGQQVPPRTTITLVISLGGGQAETPTPSATPDNDD